MTCDLYFTVGPQTLKSTETGSLSLIHYQYQSGTMTYGIHFLYLPRVETRKLMFCPDNVRME